MSAKSFKELQPAQAGDPRCQNVEAGQVQHEESVDPSESIMSTITACSCLSAARKRPVVSHGTGITPQEYRYQNRRK